VYLLLIAVCSIGINGKGVACTSWSNDATQQIKTHNQDDLNYVDQLEVEGIASEPNRNGIDDPVTAGANQF